MEFTRTADAAARQAIPVTGSGPLHHQPIDGGEAQPGSNRRFLNRPADEG